VGGLSSTRTELRMAGDGWDELAELMSDCLPTWITLLIEGIISFGLFNFGRLLVTSCCVRIQTSLRLTVRPFETSDRVLLEDMPSLFCVGPEVDEVCCGPVLSVAPWVRTRLVLVDTDTSWPDTIRATGTMEACCALSSKDAFGVSCRSSEARSQESVSVQYSLDSSVITSSSLMSEHELKLTSRRLIVVAFGGRGPPVFRILVFVCFVEGGS
jgi:hypothetical protein